MRTVLSLMAASAALLAFDVAMAQDPHHPPSASGPTAQQAPTPPSAGSRAAPAPSRPRQGSPAPSAPNGAMAPGMTGQAGMMMGQGGMGMGRSGMMSGGMMSMMMGRNGMMGDMGLADRLEGRIAFVRAELRIAENQQTQWAAFADALRVSARQIREARGPSAPAATMPSTLTTRLDQYQRMLTVRLEAVRSVRPALEQLYAVLSDDQKSTLEELAPMHIGMM